MPHAEPAAWPDLSAGFDRATVRTLHLISQIVGKVRLGLTPWINHTWHVPLYLSARGLTTGTIARGSRIFEMRFDFLDHTLKLDAADERSAAVPLRAGTMAGFYADTMAALKHIGVDVSIHTTPSEIADAVPFEDDHEARQYDHDTAAALWHALLQSERVMRRFRAGFCGKCSPVQFYWGSFDLAVTRFSGREAPMHPGGVPNFPDWVARESYSHECSSAGFWPGDADTPPMFYAYLYPKPDGYEDSDIRPDAASWHAGLGEFVLPYDAVRTADDPDAALMDFFTSTYVAGADRARWDREALECDLPADAKEKYGSD